MIAIAGPYSAATVEGREANLAELNRVAVAVLERGHIPVIGVNAALRVAELLPEAERYETIMSISLALVDACDAILVIGCSPGADRERELVAAKGLPVYTDISEVPVRNQSAC